MEYSFFPTSFYRSTFYYTWSDTISWLIIAHVLSQSAARVNTVYSPSQEWVWLVITTQPNFPRKTLMTVILQPFQFLSYYSQMMLRISCKYFLTLFEIMGSPSTHSIVYWVSNNSPIMAYSMSFGVNITFCERSQ